MGRLGKDRSPFVVAAAELLLLLVAGCAAGPPDGRYAGMVTADVGACGIGSAAQTTGSLLIKGVDVVFAPDDGVLLLRGRLEGTGHVSASATMPGADHKPFLMVFEGDLRDGRIEGRYATPRCRAAVRLTRVG